MGDFLPIIAAVVTTVGTIVGGVLLTRRLSKLGLSTEQLQVNRTLRELAETEKAKREIVEQERDALKARLTDTQHDLDDCARQRDNAYSELRIRKRDDVADEARSRQRTARRDARDDTQ
jgi:hypothetical protein